MKTIYTLGLTSALLASLIFSVNVYAALPGIDIDTVSSCKGTPYSISLQDTHNGVTVSGKIRKSHANLNRRLYGAVNIDLINGQGEVISSLQADLDRSGPARHTQQASFSIAVEQLPEDVQSLRIRY